MSDKQTPDTGGGLADVLEKLLEYERQSGEKNTLVMLALLNLLGIVNGLDSRESGGGTRGDSPWGQVPFNPGALMNLLGGGAGDGQKFDLFSLMGLLGNLLGGMPGSNSKPRPSGAEHGTSPAAAPEGKAAGKMKVERNMSRPGGKTVPQTNRDKGKMPGKSEKKPDSGVLKWDFKPEKQE